MTRACRYFRFISLGLGVLLVAVGATASYWWLYRLGPTLRLVDPDWLVAHSEVARWEEEKKDYQRLGSSPDLFFRGDRIGFYGDRDWCLWLVERIEAPDDFRHCGCTETALALMTNQRVTSWGDWATTNSDLSQEEWIRDGFLEYGLTVHLPPTADDVAPLLRLLGHQSEDEISARKEGESRPEVVPGYVQYNAFRWLRDSSFQPLRFAASNSDVTLDSNIARGLLEYSEWRTEYPGNNGLGVLAFGRHDGHGIDGSDFAFRPRIGEPKLRIGVNVFIGITIAGGGLLILCFMRGKASLNRVERDDSPGGRRDDATDEPAVGQGTEQ